jgi:uncharacterized membrane protein YgdD (TMEM256/DUF423 family)
MIRFFLMAGSILAGLSVAGGAFATHALKAKLDDRAISDVSRDRADSRGAVYESG